MDLLEHSDLVAAKAPLLAQAAGEAASPQLRNMATVVGNVLQRPRCWYYRDSGTHCLRKGGERCYAVGGDNRLHAIFGGGPCHIVCPSDLAPALQALWAVVVIAGDQGERRVPLGEFFRTPKQDPHRENVLAPGEIVTAIRVPIPPAGARGVFLKARERRVWDFALASVAVQVRFGEDGAVSAADIVLGGVAPNPWPSRETAEVILGERLTNEVCVRAAEAAVSVARPMRDNGYKVELTRGLIRRALATLAE
jgi:xanthine dehydrogenase YagS FAD-binding subunit